MREQLIELLNGVSRDAGKHIAIAWQSPTTVCWTSKEIKSNVNGGLPKWRPGEGDVSVITMSSFAAF